MAMLSRALSVAVKEGFNLLKFRRLNRFIQKWIALAGGVLLCFVTSLLIDLEKYWTASFTGVLAAATLMLFVIKHLGQSSAERARKRQAAAEAEMRAQKEAEKAEMRAQKEAAKATRRAAVATARTERINTTKQAVAEAAKKINSGSATALNVVKNGFAAAAAHSSGTIKRTTSTVTEAATLVIGSAALAGVTKIIGSPRPGE
jgi:creatinine amidohydrolase/Fe(II)-dependent formamide hydrolase-like protein